VKPAFSKTRADAGLFANTSAEIRRSGKLSKQKSVTAVSASVADPQPDLAIVRVACYGLGIIEPPRAYRASFEHELHRLLAIELDTRFLHLAIGQQPYE
jgi:hypothetical protein